MAGIDRGRQYRVKRLSDGSTPWSGGVECNLFIVPSIDLVFLSKSLTCSRIFWRERSGDKIPSDREAWAAKKCCYFSELGILLEHAVYEAKVVCVHDERVVVVVCHRMWLRSVGRARCCVAAVNCSRPGARRAQIQ